MEQLLAMLKAREQECISEREHKTGEARVAIGNYMQGLTYAIYNLEDLIAKEG